MLTTAYVRFFRATETGKIDGHTTAPAVAGAYYYEPVDYAGDALYSAPYSSPEAAVQAAIEDESLGLEDGTWLCHLVGVAGADWEVRAARALIRGLDPDAADRAAAAREIAKRLGVATTSH